MGQSSSITLPSFCLHTNNSLVDLHVLAPPIVGGGCDTEPQPPAWSLSPPV